MHPHPPTLKAPQQQPLTQLLERSGQGASLQSSEFAMMSTAGRGYDLLASEADPLSGCLLTVSFDFRTGPSRPPAHNPKLPTPSKVLTWAHHRFSFTTVARVLRPPLIAAAAIPCSSAVTSPHPRRRRRSGASVAVSAEKRCHSCRLTFGRRLSGNGGDIYASVDFQVWDVRSW